jgi:hypothetical protein
VILAEADIANITMTMVRDGASQPGRSRPVAERWQRLLDRLYRRLSVPPTSDGS